MKKAIIIGATSGIGREVAIRLAEQGVVVGIAGRRIEALEELENRFGSELVKYVQMDVTSPTATQAFDTLLERVEEPDVLLYASGIGKQNPTLDTSLEINTVKTNCEGMVRIVDHFVNYVKSRPAYTAKHRAQIAIITSVAGTNGMGSAPAYSATKKMQSTYITALTQHCRMYNIAARFSDIRPGFVDTAILNPEKHYPMLMSREKAAKIIIRGIKRRCRVVTFDWRFKFVVLFWRLIPRPIWERMTCVKN